MLEIVEPEPLPRAARRPHRRGTSKRARTSPSRRTGGPSRRRASPPRTASTSASRSRASRCSCRTSSRWGSRRHSRRAPPRAARRWPARPAGIIPPAGSRSCSATTYTRSSRCTPRTPTSCETVLSDLREQMDGRRGGAVTHSPPTASTARTSSTSASRTASRSPRSRASSRGSGSTIRSSACRPASSCSGSRRSGATRGRRARRVRHNGSFAAFRVMSQDVQAFNRFLADEAAPHGARGESARREDVRALAQRRPARSYGRRAVRPRCRRTTGTCSTTSRPTGPRTATEKACGARAERTSAARSRAVSA